MTKFVYNNSKNAIIIHSSFKLYDRQYFLMLFKNKIDLYSKSQPIT